MKVKLGFQVSGFVLVDDVAFCKFVQKTKYFIQHSGSFLFVGAGTQSFHCVTGSFVNVTVAKTLCIVRTDSLNC